MIEKLAAICSDFIILNTENEQENKEVYEFGLNIIISSTIGILGVLALGLVFDLFWGSAVFIFVFCLLRIKLGGYHAPNNIICNLSFIGTYTLMSMVYINISYLNMNIVMISLILIFIEVMLLAPIGTPNNPIPLRNVYILKRKGCSIFLLMSVLGVLAARVSMEIAFFTIMALYFNGATVLLGFIIYNNQGGSNEKE